MSSHTIYSLDASYWASSGGNLTTNGLIGSATQGFIIDPTALNAAGFTKDKINMTGPEFNAYYVTLPAAETTSIPNAANFTLANWTSKGWGSTATEVLANYLNFIDKNFVTGTNRFAINAMGRSLQTLLVSGSIGGTAYFLPLAVYGQQGFTLPGAPTSVTGTAGDGQVPLSWIAPSNGGTPITDYVIQYSSNSGSSWTTFSDGTSTATSTTVTGLTNGTSYIFRVAAVNGIGQGSFSANSSAVIPATLFPVVLSVSKIPGQWRANKDSDSEPLTSKRWALLFAATNNLIATDDRFGVYFPQANGSYKVRAYVSDNNGELMANNTGNERVRWLSEEVFFTMP
jgi:hypothetical protein